MKKTIKNTGRIISLILVLVFFLTGCGSKENDTGNFAIGVRSSWEQNNDIHFGIPEHLINMQEYCFAIPTPKTELVTEDGSFIFRGEEYFYNEIEIHPACNEYGGETYKEATSLKGEKIKVCYKNEQDEMFGFHYYCCGRSDSDFKPEKTEGETSEDFKNRCTEDMQALLDEFDFDYDLSEYEFCVGDSMFEYQWVFRKGPVAMQCIRSGFCKNCGELNYFAIDGVFDIADVYDSVPNYTEEQYEEMLKPIVQSCYEECYSSVDIIELNVREFDSWFNGDIQYNTELDRYVMLLEPYCLINFDETKTVSVSNVCVALIFDPPPINKQ